MCVCVRGAKREERKQRDKGGNTEREAKRKTGNQKKPVGLREDSDHASWILISKQNKYSPSLLLLLCSSHKPFQVPCHPFPHPDLYLLASSLLGSPSLSSPSTPHGSFLSSPLFLLHFSLHFFSSHTSLSIRFFLHFKFFLTNLLSLGCCVCLSVCLYVHIHELNFLSLSVSLEN